MGVRGWRGRALDFVERSVDGLRALETRCCREARTCRQIRRVRRRAAARVRLDYGRGVAGNRLPRGDRASGDLEPPALERRNRIDLERWREGPRRSCNVQQLHLENG